MACGDSGDDAQVEIFVEIAHVAALRYDATFCNAAYGKHDGLAAPQHEFQTLFIVFKIVRIKPSDVDPDLPDGLVITLVVVVEDFELVWLATSPLVR